MSHAKKNWITVTESKYAWERDALDFVRDRWPDHDPYRAWANFEFIALDGSINEVDSRHPSSSRNSSSNAPWSRRLRSSVWKRSR